MLEKLSNVNAIPGNEKNVRILMEKEMQGYVDEIIYDNLGSVIGVKKGNGPKVMIAGHMDEVGFVVKRIDENGFVYFHPTGGWWSQVMLAQRVIITTDSGREILGIIGSKPPHVLSVEERNKVVNINDMYIDLGVENKEEALALGIEIGDMITPDVHFEVMNNPNYLLGKAWDNRVGCYVVMEVMKYFADKEIECSIYGTGTVQEEVGLRGATTTANLIKPDIAIAIDVTVAGDTPSVTEKEANVKLGDGPVVVVMDGTTITHKGLLQQIKKIAKENNIDIQLEIGAGGTDAGTIHKAHNGCPAVTISAATRYIHSHQTIIHKKDIDDMKNLIIKIIESVNQEIYLEMLKK